MFWWWKLTVFSLTGHSWRRWHVRKNCNRNKISFNVSFPPFVSFFFSFLCVSIATLNITQSLRISDIKLTTTNIILFLFRIQIFGSNDFFSFYSYPLKIEVRKSINLVISNLLLQRGVKWSSGWKARKEYLTNNPIMQKQSRDPFISIN